MCESPTWGAEMIGIDNMYDREGGVYQRNYNCEEAGQFKALKGTVVSREKSSATVPEKELGKKSGEGRCLQLWWDKQARGKARGT